MIQQKFSKKRSVPKGIRTVVQLAELPEIPLRTVA